MSNIKWVDKHIELDSVTKKPKKLTATRFATVLGLNPWSTPFEIWCAVTRTYEKPFEDTIYTKAGKTIEPKQADYMKKSYFMTDIVSPTDIYGADYFKKTYGDFYPDVKTVGGMWDYQLRDEDGKPYTILEMKTTKRAEDWQNDIPEYYALQAALYAFLSGVDDVVMVASFLEPTDYDHPEKFVPTAENTITVPFSMSERYPTFEEDYLKPALAWWDKYVVSGVSPDFDEKKDADILKELRTNTISADTDIAALIAEAETLSDEIDKITAEQLADKEKRLKELKDMIKDYGSGQFRDGDKKVSFRGARYEWTVSRSSTQAVDKTALKKDGLLDKYSKTTESYKLNPPKLIEKEEETK